MLLILLDVVATKVAAVVEMPIATVARAIATTKMVKMVGGQDLLTPTLHVRNTREILLVTEAGINFDNSTLISHLILASENILLSNFLYFPNGP